jgi:hypothetical protein
MRNRRKPVTQSTGENESPLTTIVVVVALTQIAITIPFLVYRALSI